METVVRKKILYIVISLICLALITNFLTRIVGGRKTTSSEIKLVHIETARMTTLTDVIVGEGLTDANTKVKIVAGVIGEVDSINIDIGSFIRKGQLLVVLKNDGLLTVYSQSQNKVDRIKRIVENQRIVLKRKKELFRKELIAGNEVEQAQLLLDTNLSDLDMAMEQLNDARNNLNKLKINSPMDGVVIQKLVDIGETVFPQTQILNLGNINPVYVIADIAEEKAEFIKINQAAEVTFSAFPNKKFEGKVVKIDQQIKTRTRTFNVYIEIPNPDDRLKPGMSAYSKIVSTITGLSIPFTAVINPKEEASVFVVENGIVHMKKIVAGIHAEDQIEVVQGLQLNEQVVCLGNMQLQDGDKVEIVQRKE